MECTTDIEIYVGIDFGSSRSGFSYGRVRDSKLDVIVNTQWECSEEKYKNVTTILYDKDLPVHWGYEAVDVYNENRDNTDYELITGLKLELLKLATAKTSELEIATSRGTTKKLLRVIGDFLALMRGFIIQKLGEANEPTAPAAMKWCVTVPAIWDDKMKYFMRRACVAAGIIDADYDDDRHFVFAFEPEAASIYCVSSGRFNVGDGGVAALEKFMVVDCGGGTIDITCFKRDAQANEMEQLSRSSGGAAGGTFVDKEFIKFLEKHLDGDKRILLKRSKNFHKLMDAWELQKVKFKVDPKNRKKVFIEIPSDIAELLQQSEPVKSESFRESYRELVLTQDEMIAFFEPSIKQTLLYIEEALAEVDADIDGIVVVGGYADSSLLCDRIKDKFASPGRPLFVPFNPGKAVVHGATMFAHESPISSRCIRFTYGLKTRDAFDPSTHKSVDDVSLDVFTKLVEVGTKIRPGDVISQAFSVPPNADELEIKLFKTAYRAGRTILEEGMSQVCSFTFDVENVPESVDIKIHLKFGGTEMAVECEYKGETHQGTCNYE